MNSETKTTQNVQYRNGCRRQGLNPEHQARFPLGEFEAKTRIRQRDWLKLAGEKIRREQVGSVPTFLSVRANKFAWWKTGFTHVKKRH